MFLQGVNTFALRLFGIKLIQKLELAAKNKPHGSRVSCGGVARLPRPEATSLPSALVLLQIDQAPVGEPQSGPLKADQQVGVGFLARFVQV